MPRVVIHDGRSWYSSCNFGKATVDGDEAAWSPLSLRGGGSGYVSNDSGCWYITGIVERMGNKCVVSVRKRSSYVSL